MNYRSKDKLAEALKKGLLEKREQKAQPAPSTPINIVEEQSRFEESQAKPTSKDINLVADALKPKRQPWAQKLWDENKPAPKPVAAPAPEKKKITLESMKESVAGLNPSIDPNKKPIKAEVLAENISEIASSLTAQNRTRYKPAKRETLEEKVARLEEQLSKKKLVEAEQLNEFKKGEDIGKPGLNFKKVAAKAAKEYGSKAAGKRVAGAVLQKILHKEEVEQLDELKASTLGRYIRKSQKDASVLPQKIEAEREGDRHWPEPYKHGPKLQLKLNNRNIGMDRAEKALDRKDNKLKESVEQIDELSSATLGSYLRHASVQSHQLHKKSDEMVDKINDKDTAPWERDAYYDHNKKFLKKVQHKAGQRNLGMHRAEKKLVAKDKKYGEHHEPEDTPARRLKQIYDMERGRNDLESHDEYGYKKNKPKSSIWKGLKKHLGMKEEVEESVEQIDELSRDTLKDYVEKSYNEPHDKFTDKKMGNRQRGLNKAKNKMFWKSGVSYSKKTNENVEPLEELSAQTVSKYGDKAWRSKMNAHIDRGGADYLDDDKARKIATRTIGKRERGLALAKAMMKKKSLNEAKYSSGDVVSVDFGWSHSIGLPTSTGHVLHDSDGPVVYASFGHGEFAKQVPLSLDKIKSHTKRRK